MSSAIDVKRIRALNELKNATSRFRSEIELSLNRVDGIHRRIHDALVGKLAHAQREYELCLGTVRYSDGFMNPRIMVASKRVNEARGWLSEFSQELERYQMSAARMKGTLSCEMVRAGAMLRRKDAELRKYAAIPVKPQIPQTPRQDPIADPGKERGGKLAVEVDQREDRGLNTHQERSLQRTHIAGDGRMLEPRQA